MARNSEKQPKSVVSKLNTEPIISSVNTKQYIKNLKLKCETNTEQKQVAESFYKHDFTFVIGDAGSGKTFSAVHTALTYLLKGECKEIWIARPMLKNNLAALPGDIKEKLYPYTFPIVQNIEACIGKEECAKLIEKDIIRIMPVEVAKGCTFMESAVILDEFQDCLYEDFRTMLSRLGDNSKMLLCGSFQQISRLIGKDSSIFVASVLEKEPSVGYITLTSNHRSKSLSKILPIIDKKNDELMNFKENNKTNQILKD